MGLELSTEARALALVAFVVLVTTPLVAVAVVVVVVVVAPFARALVPGLAQAERRKQCPQDTAPRSSQDTSSRQAVGEGL